MQECDSCFAQSCRARNRGNVSRCQMRETSGAICVGTCVSRNYKESKTTLALAAHHPRAALRQEIGAVTTAEPCWELLAHRWSD
eukprot:4393711-Pleurochrysis_carterae.AAC.2